jgi:hypothetical protein
MTVLPNDFPYATTVVVTSRLVSGVTITSSNGIFCTGEKKCIPITRPGRTDASARRAIGMVLVFDAKMASGRVASSASFTDALLDGQILEHGFDDEIDTAEPRVVHGPTDERHVVVELLSCDLLSGQTLAQPFANGGQSPPHPRMVRVLQSDERGPGARRSTRCPRP